MANVSTEEQFAAANELFLAKRYEEALKLLAPLTKRHPTVFNIHYPMLQCLQQLGRVEEVRRLYDHMAARFVKEKHQVKLRKVEKWLAAHQAQGTPDMANAAILDIGDDVTAGFVLDTGDDVVGADLVNDLLDTPVPRKNSSSVPSSARRTVAVPWKGVAIVGAIAVLGVLAYMALPMLAGTAGGAPSFSADMVMMLPHGALEGRIYRRDADTLRTEMMGRIFIKAGDAVYIVSRETRRYATLSVAEMERQNPIAEMNDFRTWIQANNGQKVGTETLMGYDCEVYEAQARLRPAMPRTDTKIWYARQLAFPIKSESATGGPLGTVTMSLRNITVGTLSDDLFAPPEGYTRASSPAGLSDIPPELDDAPDNLPGHEDAASFLQRLNL